MNYFKRKIWFPIKTYLRQGLSPRKLALTVAMGVIFGIFPVIGATTLLCFLAAAIFRLNMAVIQIVNYGMYPVQLLLILPMMRLGTYLFKLDPIPDLEFILANKLKFLELFTLSVLSGVFVWFLIAIPVFFLVYLVTLNALKRT